MSLHALDPLCTWLAATRLSGVLRSAEWIVPAVQTVHILAMGLLLTAALLIVLRRPEPTGPAASAASPSSPLHRVMGWLLPVLALTGGVLICAEPARALQNPIFYLKMSLLLLAVLLALGRAAPHWRGALALALWAMVVCAGRWIAYYPGN